MTHGSNAGPEEKLCEVSRRWESIEDARRFAERLLARTDPECREAATMAVQEFAENLAKYGTPNGGAGTIALSASREGVRIRVKNVACSREDGERVKALIAEINEAPNVRELYRLRQRELLDDPDSPRVRLGLLRVAVEGSFRLSCLYEHPLLEIVAERS